MLVSFVGPFRTMRTVSIPQLACHSKWQCINQIPAKHSHIVLNPYTYMCVYIYSIRDNNNNNNNNNKDERKERFL
jgi:hypothetical protein